MSIQAITRIRSTLLSALVVAAVAVPAASADPWARDEYQRAHNAATTPDVVERYVANHRAPSSSGPAQDVVGYRFVTDTLGGNGGVSTSAVSDVVERYIVNHGGLRATGPAQDVQGYRFTTDTLGGNGSIAASAPETAGSGLDWAALGIGIGLGVLLSVVLLGARSLGRARRLAHS
jgi:hypothetical protein